MVDVILIDARGLICPAPIILLARRAAESPAGALVELLTDDPAAQFDVPAWCRMKGADYLAGEAMGEPEVPGPRPREPALRHRIRLPG